MHAGLSALSTSERGIAVPTVLAVMVIGITFSAVAIDASITSQSGTIRDQDAKSALAIADAGAQRALFTYNKVVTTKDIPCVAKDGVGDAADLDAVPVPPSTGGWCTEVGGAADPDAKVGNGYFTYWVNPCNGPGGTGDDDDENDENTPAGELCNPRRLKIVSEGYQDGIRRRVAIRAGALASTDAKAVGIDGITMDGWTELEVDAATNGNFLVKDDGSGCGSLGNEQACPRICRGDYQPALNIAVGTESGDDLILPSDTERCSDDHYDDIEAGKPPCPPPPYDPATCIRAIRVNPPGNPESDVCDDSGFPGDCVSVKHKELALPLVDPLDQYVPSLITNNSNGRLALLNQPNGDTTTGPGTVDWNPGTRTLTMNGLDYGPDINPPVGPDAPEPLTLTLGGGDYVLCKLDMDGRAILQGAELLRRFPDQPTSNVSLRIFFDSPENCGFTGPTDQISVRKWSRITRDGFSADKLPRTTPEADYHLLPLIAMVGSNSIPTTAEFDIDETGPAWGIGWIATQNMMLYAPRTDIDLDTGFARENHGFLVGKTLDIINGSEIESPPNIEVEIGEEPYVSESFVECGRPGATHPSPPDANC